MAAGAERLAESDGSMPQDDTARQIERSKPHVAPMD
jgi:hypothetical protein